MIEPQLFATICWGKVKYNILSQSSLQVQKKADIVKAYNIYVMKQNKTKWQGSNKHRINTVTTLERQDGRGAEHTE